MSISGGAPNERDQRSGRSSIPPTGTGSAASIENLDRIPRRGGALLVANHAALVPVDAMLLMHGIERELERPVYGLHHHALAAVPGVGTLLARAGGVVAHPENAWRLLRDDGDLLLVFPEGTKGTRKLYRDRYRLARFGRGGFVATAMRAGVPVIPIAIVGSEETMPTLARLPGGWPVTLNAWCSAHSARPCTSRARSPRGSSNPSSSTNRRDWSGIRPIGSRMCR